MLEKLQTFISFSVSAVIRRRQCFGADVGVTSFRGGTLLSDHPLLGCVSTGSDGGRG